MAEASGGGFRIASAFVEVKLKDLTRDDEKELRRRIEDAPAVEIKSKLDGPDNTEEVRRDVEAKPAAKIRSALATEQAGKDLDIFRERVSKDTPVKVPTEASDPLDEAWRAKLRASMKTIATDALKIPMTPDTEEFRSQLRLTLGEIESATKQKIPAELAHADLFKVSVAALADEVSHEVKAKIPVEVDEEPLKQSATRGGSMMPRLIAAAIVAGSPLIGAALTTAAGIGFIGLAAVAAHWNQDVKNSFSQLKVDVVDQMRSMTDLTAPYVQKSLHMLRDEFDSLAPSIRTALGAAGPEMVILTDGVNRLASNAMPGLVKAVQTGDPVFAGFRTFLANTGTAVGGLFTTMSQHSSAMGTAWTSWGSIVQSVFSLAGNLIAQLSEMWAAHSGQITSTISALGSVISGLASGALPVLGQSFGLALNVANGFLHVLEPLTGVLGPITGAVLAGAGAFKLLSGVMGAATLTSAGSRLGDVALKAGVFTESLTGSATAGEKVATAGGKFGSVLGRLGGALPFVGIAVGVLGLAFEGAAKSAEELNQRVQDNASNLIKGGAAADQTRKHLNDLRGENDGLMKQMDELSMKSGDNSQAIYDMNQKYKANQAEIANTSRKYEEQRNALTGAQRAQVDYNDAVEKHGINSAEAAAAGAVWRQALDQDKTKADAAAEATKSFTDRLAEHQAAVLGAVNAEIGYGNSVKTSADSQKALNDARKKYAEDSPEVQAAIRQHDSDLMAQAEAQGKAAGAAYTGSDAQEKLRITTNATNLELLNMAAASNGNLTPALQSAIGKLGAADFAAAGATVRVNDLGQAVINLPGSSKPITIQVDTATAMGRIDSFVLDASKKVIHMSTEVSTGITTNRTGGGMKVAALGGIFKPFADGGFFDGHPLTPMASGIADMIPRNTWRVVGDNRWATESYIPQDNSNRSRAILAQTNRDMGNPLGVGSSGPQVIHNHNNTVVVNARTDSDAQRTAALVHAANQWAAITQR